MLHLRIGLLVIGALAVCAPVMAQTADDLFNDQALHTLELTINSRDWEDLHINVTSDEYYPGDLLWNGIRMRNIGIRSRGLGSRYGPKPGLDLKFDHYAPRQRFLGLRSIVLDNLVTDPSMLRERVAMAFLRHVGVPASREAHARVFVNGEFAGVYAIVEPIDTTFVERTFGSTRSLLEYHWTYEYFATFLGDNLDSYRTLFEGKNVTPQSTFELYTPVRDLFKTINEAPDETFRTDVDKVFDAYAFLRLVAADALLAEWDGFLGYAGMNNVYLFHDGQRWQLIPWDKDHTFQAADYPILAGAFENVLMRRSLADPVFRTYFFDTLNADAQIAMSGNWLVNEILREYNQIRDAGFADVLKPSSNSEFESAVAQLIFIAQTRPSFVRSEAQRLR